MKRRQSSVVLAGSSILAITAAMPIYAAEPAADQSRSKAASAEPRVEEIVVTGTLIRGITPVGTNVLSIGEDLVESSGATSANQVLATLPQIGNYFGQLPIGPAAVAGSNGSNPISRPNLRGVPPGATGGGAATLILIDGQRIVGGGTQQVAIDPDIIAPDALQSVEAMTDGGSAVYGSDALGGVLNFITRRSFDGVEASARYGFADEFESFDASMIAGENWGNGSAYISYGYAWNDAIFGRDRDYFRRIDWNTGTPTGRNCAEPTVTIGAATYVGAGDGLAVGGPNVCDVSDDVTVYPSATLHNIFSRVTQDLTESIRFDASLLYANREVVGANGPLGGNGQTTGTVTIRDTNPFYREAPGAAGAAQTVRFNYAPIAGFRSMENRTDLETWSIAPQLTIDLSETWQLRTLVSYGESEVSYRNNVIDAAAQTAAINATTLESALNPYDLASTNPAVLAGIVGGIDQGEGRNSLLDARVIVDGALFSLPGGDVRVALGAEYMENSFERRQTNAALVLSPFAKYDQAVTSAFGEVQIPIIGDANGMPFLRGLNLSGSARYDEYDDFGNTFNPKIGLDYQPIEWITLRLNWGESFNAPTPSDQLGARTAGASLAPGQFLVPPPNVPGVCGGNLPTCSIAGEVGVVLSQGAVAGLEPQTGETWSIGAEFSPPFIDGLRVNLNYFEVAISDSIGRPTGTNLVPYYNNFPNLWIYQPSGQEMAAVLASLQNPANVGFTLLNPDSTDRARVSSGGNESLVGVALDTLLRNGGRTWLTGLDFSASYVRPMNFGSIDATVGGIYEIDRTSQRSPIAPRTDELADGAKLRVAASLGANIGNLRAQATLQHVPGYKRLDAATVGAFGQSRVDDFNVVNLFFRYDVEGAGLMEDLSFTLNVNNLLDQDPSEFRSVGLNGYNVDHSQTRNRYIQVGARKRF